MKRALLIFTLALASTTTFVSRASAEEIFRIEVGSDYNRYSNDELRRRVWQLERAVYQLQARIFELEMKSAYPKEPINEKPEWTCRLKSFGTTHTATAKTKSKALAEVMRKCSEATNAIHCDEGEAKCGND